MKPRKNMTGKESGKIKFQSFSHLDRFGKSVWNATCLCGKALQVRADRCGIIQSCGCETTAIQRKKYGQWVGGLSGRAWYHIIANAKTRGISIKITQQQAWSQFEKQGGKCALSGVVLELDHLKGQTASLDRIDSQRGYELDNIQWVHKDLNIAKMDFSEQQFLDWVAKIYYYRLVTQHTS